MGLKKRLYTFGCSFTSYFYPTWADFIGSTFDVYENWGQSGAGNFYIGTQVYECNQLNNFTKDDYVLVMFTNYARHDTINNNSEFMTCGNIYSQGCYSDEFIEKYWSPEYGFYNTWYTINSTYQLLKNIGCHFRIMTGFDLRLKDQYSGEMDYEFVKPRMLHCYNNLITIIPSTNLRDYTNKNYVFNTGKDHHPTIENHHRWVKNVIPELYDEKMGELLIEWNKMIEFDIEKTRTNFKYLLNKTFNKFTSTIIKEKIL